MSGAKLNLDSPVPSQNCPVDIFETSIGWFGVAYRESTIQRIKFGFVTRDDAVRTFAEEAEFRDETTINGRHWREAFRTYASGQQVSFADLELNTAWMTSFQKSVSHKCRAIPSGKMVTYGQLAKQVGSPGAARAVGSVMRTNRFPIVVPCHRVVGANGLGGFSAGAGVDTKRLLLELEQGISLTKQPMLFR